MMLGRFTLGALCCATLAWSTAPPHGPFDVESGSFYAGGLVAKGSQNAGVWYPVGAPPPSGFPVVSFAHGAPAGGQALLSATYGPLLTGLASWGFVVIAPESCVPPTGWSCIDTLYQDQLHVVSVAKANISLHPALKFANFTRVGLIGHSYGADATVTAATFSDHNVAAAVVLHPAHDKNAANITVPTMVVTGSADSICPPNDAVFVYESINARPKILLELKGGTHMEPTRVPVWSRGKDGQNRMSPSFTMFLACHLEAWNRFEACAFVEGGDDRAICVQPNVTLSRCDVEAAQSRAVEVAI